MIDIYQDEDVYCIRSPYNTHLISLIKCVAGRQWDPDVKVWTIPKNKLGFLLSLLKTSEFADCYSIDSDEDLEKNESLDHVTAIPDVDISNIQTYVNYGGSLFKHQEDCIKFSLDRKRRGLTSGFLLADQMGLGKTLEVINLALIKKRMESAKHCLIICCVNTAKYNWKDDIRYHTNGEFDGYILGSRKKRDGTINYVGSGKQKFEDLESGLMYSDRKSNKPLPYFLILNIESLRTVDKNLPSRKKYVLTSKIIDMCNDGKITMIAIDEIHKNASPQAIQGKQLIRLKNATGNNVEWIPMTGTPIVNKPTDLFLPMFLIGAHNQQSYYKWNQHYCIYGGYGDHQIVGYKNIPELKRLLDPNMLRRTKDQVLDLPEKMHIVEYVENSPLQQKMYNEQISNLKSNMDELYQSNNPLAMFFHLRQVNGCPEVLDETIDPRDASYRKVNAKLDKLLELVSNILEDEDEKIVVFSNWLAPLRTAYRSISSLGYKVASYTGTMDPPAREQHKHAFIHDPDVRVIVGTIGALGTSHTLSVASNVIFLDEPWDSATQVQAEDRCHRLNSTKSVTVYSIITKETVDERVHNIIHRKKLTSDYIVDNRLDIRKDPDLMNYLLS